MKIITISLIAVLLVASLGIVIAVEEIDFKKLYIDAMTEVAYWKSNSVYWEQQAYYYKTHANCGNNNVQQIVTQEAEIEIAGDLNGDGIIDSVDKEIMNNCLNNIGSCDNCDLNNDGSVTGLDKQIFNQLFNGVIL